MKREASFDFTYQFEQTHLDINGTRIDFQYLSNFSDVVDQVLQKQQIDGRNDLPPEVTPYFGVLWSSAHALATELSRYQSKFLRQHVLELGCGLAVPSLICAKWNAFVTAVDQHPLARELLNTNLKLNGNLKIEFIEASWSHLDQMEGIQSHPWDWIVASDVLYEKEMPERLATVLCSLSGASTQVLLTDPGRPYLQDFVHEMGKRGFATRVNILPIKKSSVDADPSQEIFTIYARR